MADIAVSTLIQQIENHVLANRSAEALALCTHILYYFPKHLETYSLMAQALTVEGNLNGALDIYRRVLSADPENPGAYAALAHIFDARRQVEEAVWHMERAFELAPAQQEIRQELLRLYGQYEAAPRERLKLTRGALARLYAQEGLYDQAIHEFREIGSSTLSRYDIRIALAETMWRAGRTRDAADAAQSLLDALPYCLKANLILGTAWHESAIPESQKYLERAVSLDPSNQVAHKMLGARSPMRVTSVTVPEYVEGAPPPYAAVQIETPPIKPYPLAPLTEEDKALKIFDEPMPAPTVELRPEPVEPISASPDAIVETPLLDTTETDEPASDLFAPAHEPKPSNLNDELPPWLRSDEALPLDAAEVETQSGESSSRGAYSNPDWLTQLRRNFSDEPQEEKGIPAELIPVPIAAEPEPQPETKPEPEPPPPATQEPILPEPMAETQAQTTEDDLPDWLSEKAKTVEERTEPVQPSAWLTESTLTRAETSESVQPDPSSSQPAGARSETPAEITEPAKPSAPSTQSAPARDEMPAAASKTRVPKWVEVLSRREPEESPPQEKIPMRAESVAPTTQIAEPRPAALSDSAAATAEIVPPKRVGRSESVQTAPPSVEPRPAPQSELASPTTEIVQPKPAVRSESVASAPQIAEPAPVAPTVPAFGPMTLNVQPEPPPPVAEYPEPEPAIAVESSAPATQVAEPETPIVVETAPVELSPSRTRHQPKYYSRLAQARAHRNADRVGDALREYEYVIAKSPRLVPEVIMDLESLVASGDAPLDAHRLLGDAYTRAGRLNDALERYRYVKRQAESNP